MNASRIFLHGTTWQDPSQHLCAPPAVGGMARGAQSCSNGRIHVRRARKPGACLALRRARATREAANEQDLWRTKGWREFSSEEPEQESPRAGHLVQGWKRRAAEAVWLKTCRRGQRTMRVGAPGGT